MTLKEQEKLFLTSLVNTLSMKQVRDVLVEYEHEKDMRSTRRELLTDVKKELEDKDEG